MPVEWGAKPPAVFPLAFSEALRRGGGPLPPIYGRASVLPPGEVRKRWRGYIIALRAAPTHPLHRIACLSWRLEARQGVFWVVPGGTPATDDDARAALVRDALRGERRRK